MRRSVLLICTLFAAVCATSTFGDDYVNGYTRKDGTYVPPHYRSSNDGNFNNNWSTKGNQNPYTGREGTRVTPPINNGGSSGSGYNPFTPRR